MSSTDLHETGQDHVLATEAGGGTDPVHETGTAGTGAAGTGTGTEAGGMIVTEIDETVEAEAETVIEIDETAEAEAETVAGVTGTDGDHGRSRGPDRRQWNAVRWTGITAR